MAGIQIITTLNVKNYYSKIMLPSQNRYLHELRDKLVLKKKAKTEAEQKNKLNQPKIQDCWLVQSKSNRYSLPQQSGTVKKAVITDRKTGKIPISSQLSAKINRNIYLRKTEAYDKENISSGIYSLLQKPMKKNCPFSQRNAGLVENKILKGMFQKPKIKIEQQLFRHIRSQKQKTVNKLQQKKVVNKTNPQSKCIQNGRQQHHNKHKLLNKINKMNHGNKINSNGYNRIKYETFSLQGSKQFNQDCIRCDKNIWILCDGHGQYGHEVSEFVADLMLEFTRELIHKNNVTSAKITEMFSEVQEVLVESNIDSYLSGSTCTIIIHHDGQLYCANVGDSPAIILREEQNSHSLIFKQHKPGDIEQKKRIQFFGGQVKRHPLKVNLKQSPLRLWGTGEDGWGPGLAVSRAFGDRMAKKYGLISEPSIVIMPVFPELKHILIGSDGLFDKIPYTEAQFLIQRQTTLNRFREEQLCASIVKIARKRWSTYSDDVSAVLIYF